MVIDPSLYEGSCIEYATSFLTKEGHEDVEGIYLGSTENGKPEGYGAFYYTTEDIDDEGIKCVKNTILFGNWSAGNHKIQI